MTMNPGDTPAHRFCEPLDYTLSKLRLASKGSTSLAVAFRLSSFWTYGYRIFPA